VRKREIRRKAPNERNAPGSFSRLRTFLFSPYSPKCLEGKFSELRLCGVLGR
jgi:hypothetical protein